MNMNATHNESFMARLGSHVRSYREALARKEKSGESLELMGQRHISQQMRGETADDLTSVIQEFEKRSFILDHEREALLWVVLSEFKPS